MKMRSLIRRALALMLLLFAAASPALALTAEQAMAKAVATMRKAPSISASFTAEADGKASAGTIAIGSEKFALVTADYGTWFDGANMWSWFKSTGEASLTEPTDQELMEINPFYIISHAHTQFKSRLLSNKNGKCVVMLTPRVKGNSIKSAEITLDTSTWLPLAVNASFSNGAHMKIAITQANIGKSPLPVSAFRFSQSKYPGTEVVDLR